MRAKALPIFLYLILWALLLGIGKFSAFAGVLEPVNAIIGDEGFELVHRRAPVEADSEVERIRTHLVRVIDLLRAADTSELDPTTFSRRSELVNALEGYAAAGEFPQNTVFQGRRPVFIDPDGRLCAVGYLVAVSAGRQAAEAIAAAHRYDYVLEMHDSLVDNWAKENGFTLRELAMIQPAYQEQPEPRRSGDWAYELNDSGEAVILGFIQQRILYFSVKGRRLIETPAPEPGPLEVRIPDSIDAFVVREVRSLKSYRPGGEGGVMYDENASGLITSLIIPESVTNIGQGAFSACSRLSLIEVAAGNPAFASLDGVLYDKSFTRIIKYPNAKQGGFSIPPGMVTWENGAFSGCSGLTKVDIPFGVAAIGADTFSDCTNLTEVTLPSSISSIGARAFAGCGALARLDIPGSVTNIGESAFSRCVSLVSFSWPASVPVIENSIFANCTSLTEVLIPPGVIEIGSNAFAGCGALQTVSLPGSLASIDSSAFRGCGELQSFDVAQENSSYSSDDGVIFDKSRTNLVLFPPGKSGRYTVPEGVVEISQGAFSHCNLLAAVYFPPSLVSIGAGSFSECDGLTSADIPGSTVSVGSRAFEGCDNLRRVTMGGGVTSIGAGAFSGCTTLTRFSWPATVPIIEGSTFENCAGLAEIFLPAGLVEIRERAFDGCGALPTLDIPDSVTRVGHRAFSYCSNLRSVTIGSGLVSLGAQVFIECRSLKSLLFHGDAPVVDPIVFRYPYCTDSIPPICGLGPPMARYDVFDSPHADYRGTRSLPIVYYMQGSADWGSRFGGAPQEFSYITSRPTMAVSMTPSGTRRQGVVFRLPPRIIFGGSYPLAAHSSSGLPVVYEVSDESAAAVEAGHLRIKRAAPFSITARAFGNSVYATASRTIEVQPVKRTQTIGMSVSGRRAVGEQLTVLLTLNSPLEPHLQSSDPATLRVDDLQRLDLGDNGARGMWYAVVTVLKRGKATLSASQTGDDGHAAAPSERRMLVLR